MESRLVPLNAVLAMYSNTVTSWPRPFFAFGYRLRSLEFGVLVPPKGTVTVDALGFKASENRFACHEAKSGSSIDAAQANKYLAIDAQSLVRSLGISLTDESPPRQQPIYACLEEHESRIIWELSEAGCDPPLLVISDSAVRHAGAKFDDPELEAAFASPITVPGQPPAVVTVDAESPDDLFDQLVHPTLVAAASRHETSVTLSHLAEESLPHFAIYPAAYQRRLKQRVEDSARRAMETDPTRWSLQRIHGGGEQPVVVILSTPEDSDARGRTQQYQAIRSRLQSGQRRRPRPEIPGQASLFDRQQDLEAELEAAGRIDVTDDGDGQP